MGSWVHQLTSNEGDTYWRQSYSTQLYPFNKTVLQDPKTVTEPMTGLPEGWTCDAFIISEDAQLVAGFLLDRNASSYPLSPRVPDAGRLVGTGGTAAVFTHRRQPDTVIKISYRNVPGGPERVGVGDERRVLNRLA